MFGITVTFPDLPVNYFFCLSNTFQPKKEISLGNLKRQNLFHLLTD